MKIPFAATGLSVVLLALLLAVTLGQVDAPPPADLPQYGPAERIELQTNKAGESSGVAVSRRDGRRFYTMNDSGGTTALLVFDEKGTDLGEVVIEGAQNIDWEDIASLQYRGRPYLLIADVGDNIVLRPGYRVYLVPEPEADQRQVKPEQTILFQYDDESHDCEAAAFASDTGEILLAGKSFLGICNVYALAISPEPTDEMQTARKIATARVPAVTAMDISPDARRLMLCTYQDGYEFVRADGETWADALARPPRRIALPERAQGEAICYGADGKTLYLTSEGFPTPLWRVPVVVPIGSAP